MRNPLLPVTRAARALRRRFRGEPRERPLLDVPRVRLGSDYGGYAVCPEGLGAASVVYSFGIGEDLSFDLELIARFGASVHGFDPTPRSIAWVRSQELPPEFTLHEYGLAAYDGVARFTPPDDPSFVSHTLVERAGAERPAVEVPVRRLASVAAELGHARVDVLKMDVEGAEYDVIDDLLANGPRPAQLLVEFHHHMPEIALERTESAIDKLERAGYRVFHVSPSAHEFSFIRRPSRAAP
ncbi:MAG: FkbM family methyltransferase [Sorangiineae bacterium]|nr:FkbM family methyltransferase [Polyangiaceae bacterium]MEB2324092.1 FkbM family methyltransferase [Sorangiineae bacterium]